MLRSLVRTVAAAPSASAPASPLFLLLRRAMASASSSSVIRVPGPLVSVDWLKSHFSRVKCVDASFYLPNEKRDAKAEFIERGRIKGAVLFEIEQCITKGGPNPHSLPSKEQFAEYMSSLGLARDDAIVIYDGKGIFSAPRARFTMRYFGADNVAILDGGWKAWTAAGGEVESGPVKEVAAQTKFDARDPPSDFVQDLASVRANSESNSSSFQLVDARSAGRFAGTEPEPRPDMSSGHIAGSVSVPFMSLLRTDANTGATHMKSREELQQAFEQQGVAPLDTKRKLVASCGSGVTACVDLLGLELLGRTENLGLYNGSWMEWASLNQKIETRR